MIRSPRPCGDMNLKRGQQRRLSSKSSKVHSGNRKRAQEYRKEERKKGKKGENYLSVRRTLTGRNTTEKPCNSNLPIVPSTSSYHLITIKWLAGSTDYDCNCDCDDLASCHPPATQCYRPRCVALRCRITSSSAFYSGLLPSKVVSLPSSIASFHLTNRATTSSYSVSVVCLPLGFR